MPKPAKSRDHALQARIIACICAGKTSTEIAADLGETRACIENVRRRSGFKEALARAREDIVRRATDKLSAVALEAAEALRESMRSTDGRTKVAAASAALNHLIRLREHLELDARLRALESQMKEGRDPCQTFEDA